jgi:hypothetical protein
MSKRIIFIGLFTLSIFCFSPMIFAEQYYDQYSGNAFVPSDSTSTYLRSYDFPYIAHNDTNDEGYVCPVTLNVPDGSAYFIKSIGIRFKDNLPDGHFHIVLKRKNLFTGNVHIVANWSSGHTSASSLEQTASKGTEDGVKLVDTKKFVYWLRVVFQRDGDVNPYPNLVLYQVRVHYGT